MKTLNKYSLKLLILAAFFCAAQAVSAIEPVHFKVKIDDALAPNQTISGRLLIFMTNKAKPLDGNQADPNAIAPDPTNPNAVWIAAKEISSWQAGATVEISGDDAAFPSSFADAAAGEYQVMALLDRDHSYTYDGTGAGDFYSSVVKINLPAGEAELTLSKAIPERKINEREGIKIVEFESPQLSAFWGRPMKIEASVMLPPNYDKSGKQTYPTVYLIHGYSGTHLTQLGNLGGKRKLMAEGKIPEMIYVALNAKFSLGHHVFADSVNNGPWGTALVKEFIPYLEKQFRMDAKPSGRFLTGHSSGGWSTLWVMINHPDFFGGTWSTSPDPTDFRNFTGPDLYNPAQNAYKNSGGKEYNLVRDKGLELASLRQYALQEQSLGAFGGQFASFEAVFSPKGIDGRPMPLFDRETGVIDQSVAKAWEKYDISKYLQANWKTLQPKLKGKLHIYVGTADTFHLDESLRLLDAELKKLGSDARIEYLEGRTHFDVYKDGLNERIAKEMYAVARPKKAGGK